MKLILTKKSHSKTWQLKKNEHAVTKPNKLKPTLQRTLSNDAKENIPLHNKPKSFKSKRSKKKTKLKLLLNKCWYN